MNKPIAKVGDRTDFTAWPNPSPMVGEVIEVIEGPVKLGYQCEHQYVIQVNNQRFRVAESSIATPYGPWDD